MRDVTGAFPSKPYRAVVISGLSYTGSTTMTHLLAKSLSWQVVSAGARFREFCHQHGLSIIPMPLDTQRTFDEQFQNDLRIASHTVFEGRFLAYFSRDLPDVLKVRLDASYRVREARCLQREADICNVRQAAERIQLRDSQERWDAEYLYDLQDFLDTAYFDLCIQNDQPEDLTDGVGRILTILQTSLMTA